MTTTALDSSFVFYQSFFNMIGKIPDGETRLAAYDMICAYALNGMEPQSDNWLLELVFCAVKPLIDKNRKRRENGKKGGRKAVETGEMQIKPTITEVQTAEPVTNAQETDIPINLVQNNDIQYNKVNENEIPIKLVRKINDTQENELNRESIPRILVKENIQSQDNRQPAQAAVVQTTEQEAKTEQGAKSEQTQDIVLYGKNKYPVTQMELKKIQNFARELFQKYKFGRILNEFDIDKIMKYTVARREINGVAVGVLDKDKADLLEYAVEQAEAAEKLNWRYIEGMYRNFLLRDIKTAAEAYQYDLSRSIPVM